MKPKSSKTICAALAPNLDTLVRAAKDGRVALMQVYDKSDGLVKAALVTASDRLDGKEGFEFAPFALMIDDDPYKRLCPAGSKPGYFANGDGTEFYPGSEAFNGFAESKSKAR